MLVNKVRTGVNVEVITTPPDNIAKKKKGVSREKVEKMYGDLKANGINLLPCKWESGEPRLTTTSMSGTTTSGIGEKWYSLHLQLFINEKQAMITSQNLVSEENLEVYYLSSEPTFLEQATNKYDLLKELFLEPEKIKDVQLPGRISKFFDEKMLQDTLDFHSKTERYKIKHYFAKKIPQADLRTGMFICPFEGRLREFLYKLIDSAETFLYFFIETFFDEELIIKIEEKIEAHPNIKIKIITSPATRIRQNKQQAKNMIYQLLSLGVDVQNLDNIQGKFWVSDDWLAIPSGDFNKMNLGYIKSKSYWRADTQLIFLDKNNERVNIFKEIFEQHFKPLDIGSLCIKDIESSFMGSVKRYRIKGTKEAREYIARFKSSLLIKTEKDAKFVIKLAIKLAKNYNKKRLEGIFVIMAIILYYLQRREHKLEEIAEKLDNVVDKSKVDDAVERLLQLSFILKSGDLYRVNVEKFVPS